MAGRLLLRFVQLSSLFTGVALGSTGLQSAEDAFLSSNISELHGLGPTIEKRIIVAAGYNDQVVALPPLPPPPPPPPPKSTSAPGNNGPTRPPAPKSPSQNASPHPPRPTNKPSQAPPHPSPTAAATTPPANNRPPPPPPPPPPPAPEKKHRRARPARRGSCPARRPPRLFRLFKRASPLYDLWKATSKKAGPSKTETIAFNPPAQKVSVAATEMYGCTGIVIVDGKGAGIGHYAEVVSNPNKPSEQCITLDTPAAVKKYIIDKMEEGAWDMVDFTEAAQVYIIDSSATDAGYRTIKKWLEDKMGLKNFKRVQYSRSTPMGERPTASGKVVAQFEPDASGGGTARVWIMSENPVFTQKYDKDGNAC